MIIAANILLSSTGEGKIKSYHLKLKELLNQNFVLVKLADFGVSGQVKYHTTNIVISKQTIKL